MVTEPIDHIDVFHAQRVDGEVTQNICIHYHCIGAFDVPDWKDIPELEVLIETRKGVALATPKPKKQDKRSVLIRILRSYKDTPAVEATGPEPAASWSQTRHSTKLSYASMF